MMRTLWLIAALLAIPVVVEAHTHAQCLASQPCKDAVAAAVATAVLEKDAEILDLKDQMAILAPPPPACDVIVPVGAPLVWTPGVVVCLADGEHAVVVKPPKGLGGTIRAETYGKATVQGIELAENAMNVWGLRVACVPCPGGSAIWTRQVTP